HPERPVETRRKGSARHYANFALTYEKFVALASDTTAVFSADSNKVALERVALRCGGRGGADEVAPELHERTEARLERRSRAVKLVDVKRQSRLHSERIARAETAGDYSARRAGFEDRAEKLRGGRRPSEKLKAIFAGVAGA